MEHNAWYNRKVQIVKLYLDRLLKIYKADKFEWKFRETIYKMVRFNMEL